MTKKRRTVQPDDIIAINEAYVKIGTYAGAGRATGWSGSTVKRYIIADYVPKAEQKPIEKEEFNILPANELEFPKNWKQFLTLTVEETQKKQELQQTILY